MRIFHAFIALACIAFAAVSGAIVAAREWIASLMSVISFSRAPFSLDNGHPRSPLASLRAGCA